MMLNFFRKSDWTSPNFNDRKGTDTPILIILHYTGMRSANEALERLCDPVSEVSAHYVIEENGKAHKLVDISKRAWHAGVSYWGGLTDINSLSIGIEIVNPGHEFGYKDFPARQIQELEKLCVTLMKENGISPHNVLAHSDIAPSRKQDPGEKFPWERLARHGIGLWPKPTEMDYQSAEDIILDKDKLRQLFTNYGYNPEETMDDVLTAFHRHYYPEKFADDGGDPASADILTIAKMLSLTRQKREIGIDKKRHI